MLAQVSKAFDWLKVRPHVPSGVVGWLLIGLLVFASTTRRTERVDLTRSAPADTLFYLETRDLGAALSAITSANAFRDVASKVPDLSALDGMQVAVAITGFEASEERLNEEASEATFRPRFVAIAETPFWEWQARRFTEGKLGGFVREMYGEGAETEVSAFSGGTKYTWRSADGRRTFAFVRGSRILFSNDESAIEKCLAVERRETEGLDGNNTIRSLRVANEDAIGFGYLSPDGVAQLSSIAGLSAAMAASENDLARSFIARTLPQVVRGTVKDISWVAVKSSEGIEDRFEFTMSPGAARALASSARLGDSDARDLDGYLAEDAFTVTRYDLADPDVAWRTVIETASSTTDAFSGKMMAEFAGSLFDPYGVSDAGMFLKAVRGQILTARFDADGEESVAVVGYKNADDLKLALAGIDFKRPAEKIFEADVWKSEDGEIAAAFTNGKALLGNPESISRCLEARSQGRGLAKRALYENFSKSRAAAVTLGKEDDTAERVIETLSDKKDANMKVATNFMTETRFSDKGFERRTVSPFGFLGVIVAQFARRG